MIHTFFLECQKNIPSQWCKAIPTCYFMGMVHFHMQLILSYFRRYKSTYWILNDLLDIIAFSKNNTCGVIWIQFEKLFAMLSIWCRCSLHYISPHIPLLFKLFCSVLFFLHYCICILIQLTNVCKMIILWLFVSNYFVFVFSSLQQSSKFVGVLSTAGHYLADLHWRAASFTRLLDLL